MYFLCFRKLYPVNVLFFLIQTLDGSKRYFPENKTVIDVPSGIKIFLDLSDKILKHVQDVAAELADSWNSKYVNHPEV